MTASSAPTPADQRISATIFGTLTVRRGADVLDARSLGGPKPRQILEILLLNIGVPVSKDRLIDLLWGSNPPREALTSIESYVSVLRRRLQPGGGRSGPLRTTTGGYVLDAASVDLDLTRFDALLRDAQQVAPAEAYPMLVDALGMATGPLLGDELRLAWAEEERRRHTVAVTTARVLAAETASVVGRPEESTRWAREALEDDPLNERAWTALILGLEQAGRHAEGLKAYAECRTVLDRELGCEPSVKLRQAHARLLSATASGESELSEAVNALLVLNARLQGGVGASESEYVRPDQTKSLDAVREAGQVLTSFLQRVLAAA